MNIALDYDGTFTSDPALWLMFVLNCIERKHSVYIVTMRYPSECDGSKGSIDERLRSLSVPIVCTARQAKKDFCHKLGINIHIWIDDHPEAVHLDAMQIWKDSATEGNVVVPDYSGG